MKTEKVILHILKKMIIHNKRYLDKEAVLRYQTIADAISLYGVQDVNIRRNVRTKLMEEYGILEIEAINILNHYHVEHYILKYEIIRKCDEMKLVLLQILQRMSLPKELGSKQIDILSKLFASYAYSSKLLEMYHASDQQSYGCDLIAELLKKSIKPSDDSED